VKLQGLAQRSATERKASARKASKLLPIEALRYE